MISNSPFIKHPSHTCNISRASHMFVHWRQVQQPRPTDELAVTTGSPPRNCPGHFRSLANQATAAKIDKWAQASVPEKLEISSKIMQHIPFKNLKVKLIQTALQPVSESIDEFCKDLMAQLTQQTPQHSSIPFGVAQPLSSMHVSQPLPPLDL